MIATILPTSTSFHAVGYNERKVAKGVAHLLEIKNFGPVEAIGRPTADDLTAYLDSYSARNTRIRKPQFHIAFSCKGHENTERELLDFAHEYLRQMGYGEPGQPLLVYGHTDTSNTHIHVITSRVAPDGRKIDHRHERVRSQRVIDKILGNDAGEKARQDIAAAFDYRFSSITQFKALMNSLGYECYENDGTVSIKRGGAVCLDMPLEEIGRHYRVSTFDKQRRKQLRAIFSKYRDLTANRRELSGEMKRKFGIELVFFGKTDSPYGYMIIDHNSKSVMNGGKIYSIRELLDFSTADERFSRIEAQIDTLLADNPKMTIPELNDILSRQFKAYVKGGCLHRGGDTRQLRTHMWEALKRNNRIRWAESFSPATEAERDFLCRIGRISVPQMVDIYASRSAPYHSRCLDLTDIFDNNAGDIPRQTFRDAGFSIRDIDGRPYAADLKARVIIDLEAEGFDMTRIRSRELPLQHRRDAPHTHKTLGVSRAVGDAGASRGDNREWEVGYKGEYDRIDDDATMKR